MTEPEPRPGVSATPGAAGDRADFTTGIYPSQALRAAVGDQILASQPIGEDQIQPASVDLRLGDVAWRVQASFLPGRRATVKQKIDLLGLYSLDLTRGAVLERNCVYIVPLLENLVLKKRLAAIGNPKSSTGRLDIFARLLTDYAAEFDRVREGYKGPLYAEISPRAFSIRVHAGSRLLQLRLRRGSPGYSDTSLRRLNQTVPLVHRREDLPAEVDPGEDPGGPGEPGAAADHDPINRGVEFSVDGQGDPDTGLVAYRARRNAGLIDIDRVNHYEPADFWEPIHTQRGRRGLILDPHDFYILASREAVTVPPDHAAEMIAYDTQVGEFRVHYAGFFDPGFGSQETGGLGSRAVLEVRAHEVPFVIEDGQVVGRLVYERLTGRPDKLYGQQIGSSYQRQTLTLSKQFKRG